MRPMPSAWPRPKASRGASRSRRSASWGALQCREIPSRGSPGPASARLPAQVLLRATDLVEVDLDSFPYVVTAPVLGPDGAHRGRRSFVPLPVPGDADTVLAIEPGSGPLCSTYLRRAGPGCGCQPRGDWCAHALLVRTIWASSVHLLSALAAPGSMCSWVEGQAASAAMSAGRAFLTVVGGLPSAPGQRRLTVDIPHAKLSFVHHDVLPDLDVSCALCGARSRALADHIAAPFQMRVRVRLASADRSTARRGAAPSCFSLESSSPGYPRGSAGT